MGHIPLIPAIQRRGQEDQEFKAILKYKGNPRPAWAMTEPLKNRSLWEKLKRREIEGDHCPEKASTN